MHPSQEAAARSLGLSRFQALRRVILPQAIRRVIPPLLNDFIGLQKDTALVGTLGVIEAFNQSQIDSAATFTYGAYLAAAALFVAITIPLARLTDWLIARDRQKRQATGARAHERAQAGRRAQVVRRARGAARDRPRARRPRGRLPDRRLRLGQVDAAALRQPARAGRRGPDLPRRRGDHAARRGRERGAAADRDRLPGLQPLPAHDRAAQRHARAARRAQALARRGGGAGARAARALRARATGATSTRTGSRAASSSASRSCARWRCGRS